MPAVRTQGRSEVRGIVRRVVTTADIEQCGRVLAATAASPARVIMFGSYARGSADSDSDLDFLAIEEHAAKRAQVKGSTVARALAEGRVLAQP